MTRGKSFTLIELIVIIVIITLLAVIAVPQIVNFYQRRIKVSEAKANLGAIRDCEEVYRGEHDKYIRCSPNPPGIPKNTKVAWQTENQTGWPEIGFEPDNGLCYQYEVKTSPDRLTFVVYARGDLDADGTYSEISLDQDGNWSVVNQFE